MSELRRYNWNSLSEALQTREIRTFVETGSGHGGGIDSALKVGFEKIYSCEIDSQAYEELKRKYKDNGNVFLHHGKSEDFFKEVLNSIDENVLFWLDAHFPAADLGRAKHDDEKDMRIRMPLDIELNLIKEMRGDRDDYIMADDMFLYKRGVGAFELERLGLSHIANYNLDFLKSLEDTFEMKEERFQTGILHLWKKSLT